MQGFGASARRYSLAERRKRSRSMRRILWLVRVGVIILFVALFAFGVIDAELLTKLITLL